MTLDPDSPKVNIWPHCVSTFSLYPLPHSHAHRTYFILGEPLGRRFSPEPLADMMKLHPLRLQHASSKSKDILLHSHSSSTLKKSNVDQIILPNIQSIRKFPTGPQDRICSCFFTPPSWTGLIKGQGNYIFKYFFCHFISLFFFWDYIYSFIFKLLFLLSFFLLFHAPIYFPL